MEVWNEPAVLFEKSTMFTKSRFCKIYKVTSENPSGYLPHSHDYMQIWYITRGCCEHWVEGQKHLMARGDIHRSSEGRASGGAAGRCRDHQLRIFFRPFFSAEEEQRLSAGA